MKQNVMIIALLLQMLSFSQSDTIYFSSNFTKTNKSNAKYYRIIKFGKSDKNLLNIKDFHSTGKIFYNGFCLRENTPKNWEYSKEGECNEYYENGKLKITAFYKDGLNSGLKKEYFKNGKLYKFSFYDGKVDDRKKLISKIINVYDTVGNILVNNGFGKSKEICEDFDGATEEGIYKNGLKDSIWIGKYKNGNTYYSEQYKNGIFKNGVSYDSLKKEHKYKNIEEKPEFDGGPYGLMAFLRDEINYPAEAATLKIEGRVFIRFCVNKVGDIEDCTVLVPLNEYLDEEALRVVKVTNGKWKSGKKRGFPISVYSNIPITFKLAKQL